MKPSSLHALDLLWMLTRIEFRARDQGTFLGFLWTLLRPLAQFAVLYAVFSRWMGPRIPDWPAFLLVGVVQWDFFAGATTHGLTSLRRKAGLITHHAFPRVVVVLSSVLAVLLSHLLEWLVLLAALPLLGVGPSASWLLIPALVAAEAGLALGAACVLAALSARVRDVEQAWSLALYALFFLTPVFYTLDLLPPATARLVALNPLGCLIEAARALLWGRAPAALAGPLALAAAVAAAGLAAFPRLARDAEERL